jgi:hypothetical protein
VGRVHVCKLRERNRCRDDEQNPTAMTATERLETRQYRDAFQQWMTAWNPHAFVTVNVPHERSAPREPSFYLTCWTRCAEADLLGPRTLTIADFNRRIVWLLRREVSADGLVHYHAVVRFPASRPWRDEQPDIYNVVTRCDRLQAALRLATTGTPEPFTPKNVYQPFAADIDVRPYDADRNHAGYLLKGMRQSSLPDDREFSTSDLLHDSGLIVLPHLPLKKLHAR